MFFFVSCLKVHLQLNRSTVKLIYWETGLARWALAAHEPLDMSIRTAAQRLIQNGRVLLRTLRNPENRYSSTYARGHLDKIHVVEVGECPNNNN